MHAEMAEWLMAADCKSATQRVTEVRILLSAPVLRTIVWNAGTPSFRVPIAGIAQLVERQPSKLNVAGSNPVSRSTLPVFRPRPVTARLPPPAGRFKAHIAQR